MVLVTTNWRMYLIGLAVSLGIFLVIYFTVIKSSTDTANKAIQTGLEQTQQGLDQAQKQLNQSGGGVNTAKANQELDSAQALAQCLTTAGTDTDAVAACQSQFGG
jgi:F0F1-type ATP synthase membrane subunit b/b'